MNATEGRAAPAIEPRGEHDMKTIDLSGFYTNSLDDEIHHKPGNDLKAVPHGVSEFAGTTFDVNGLIQLSGSISKEKTGQDYPHSVTGIQVHAKGRAIHFLQCSSWHDVAGAKIGEYRVRYAGGYVETIAIVYQGSVVDWWYMAGAALPADAQVAWTGDNDRTRGLGHSIQLYKYSWSNPRPDIEIEEIDFVSAGKESAPFLMAITVE